VSNYLFALGRKRDILNLHSRLGADAENPDAEITLKRHSLGLWILIVERRPDHIPSSILSISSRNHTAERAFFRGWFQDHSTRRVILGPIGYQRHFRDVNTTRPATELATCEGTFVLARWSRDRLIFQQDLYALFPVIHCTTPRLFLASDSLFMISKCRQWVGLPCSMNRVVAMSKGWRTFGIASAPLSNQTIIEDVHMLSPGCHLEIELGRIFGIGRLSVRTSRELSTTPVHHPLRQVFELDVGGYAEALRTILERMQGVIGQWASMDNIQIEFGLSGGLDSRVLLGVLLSAPEMLEGVHIRTSTQSHLSADHAVATRLSERFGFALNDVERSRALEDRNPAKKIHIENPLGLWALANLGLYDSVFLTSEIWNPPSIIAMGGQGAETIKDTWGGATLHGLISKGVYPEVRKSVLELMEAGLRGGGIDPTAPDAVKWHHLAFKSAFHNGRFVTASPLALRPFLQQAIFAVSQSDDNPHRGRGRAGIDICHDLLILLDADLAAEPYDSAEKDLTPAQVVSRQQALANDAPPSAAHSPYALLGDVSDIACGPPTAFMAQVNIFDGDLITVRERLAALATTYWDKLGNRDLRRVHKHTYREAMEMLASDSPLAAAGVFAARLCSLMLVDEADLA